ncbi:MAG: 50S ribosomal protein L22 [Acidimicrobiales bacterium]|nr:50S ribosomal protein L22 [Acidimicrobiales bacterium]MYH75493.1 50S ribosomal protein L22 [Acidimicrobiales bacterium]MYK70269.1 50S ribosomal protein L22 [Acidimicrobiales bacterium]
MSGLIDLDVIAGAKATHKYARLSASKARVVLNLIRDEDLALARDRLRFCERGAAEVVSKVLESAVANATNNEQLDADELYVAECWADEGPVLKRWRPRARGRATRIFKQTSHITVIVAQLSPEELEMREARLAASGSQTAAAARAARVAASRATTDTGEADESAPDDADDIVATADEAAEAAIDDTGEAIAAEVDAADPNDEAASEADADGLVDDGARRADVATADVADPEEDVADPEERN